MENVAEFYAKELYTIEKPAVHLAKFLSEVAGKPLSRDSIVMMGRLVNIYGRKFVYLSILDVGDMYSRLDTEKNLFGLLSYFCKKRLESSLEGYKKEVDLTNKIKEINESIEKQKAKLPKVKTNPFGE